MSKTVQHECERVEASQKKHFSKSLCMDKPLFKIENVKIVIFIKHANLEPSSCEMLQPLNSLFKEELIQFE